jgi:hypothetical protein
VRQIVARQKPNEAAPCGNARKAKIRLQAGQ